MNHTPRIRRALAVTAGLGLTLSLAACAEERAEDGGVLVGLITKTETNPFFVKMREGAQAAAEEHGVTLQTYAGDYDGDNEGQVQAVENLMAAGAAGILITPNDSAAIVPVLEQARASGIMVIALDTPVDPADAVDATFATDNFLAGELIGRWAAAHFEELDEEPRVAMLDLNPNQIAVDVARDQGFLQGLGVDIADPGVIGDEDDPRVVGHEVTEGAEEGGRTAMENLLQRDPDLNLVYTINEPAAAGAYEALKAAGVEEDVVIVSVDGGCPGVRNVGDGVIGATSMQFPLDMAALGVSAVAAHAADGTVPEASEGLDFIDTGVELITDLPKDGLESRDGAWGLDHCWG
ncbi:sugar ABC transporter substrate-binding protein [Nocardiopsis lambiniae]|uniref:Sugar ABC transporter substrate-binding protein n=1 Tax=Nocardiopsis lambiniae TaxID=3075539 RepID=A0ABU2MD99_9ACTN|nr:sugar ABC transporter substrate-binding protein [Nocardiopsis sp. DSM 44743]MDT0330095.1 sugar ABC transporter substrate-binding protein [Nocardiopsis sp. DSM 44743]